MTFYLLQKYWELLGGVRLHVYKYWRWDLLFVYKLSDRPEQDKDRQRSSILTFIPKLMTHALGTPSQEQMLYISYFFYFMHTIVCPTENIAIWQWSYSAV